MTNLNIVNSQTVVYQQTLSIDKIALSTSNVNVMLYNSIGKLIFSGQSKIFEAQNFSDLEVGVYYLFIPENNESIQLVKVKD